MRKSHTTLVITTFSEDGYNLYGQKFVETWCRFWPENYRLRIYAEHDFTVDDDRVEIVDIHKESAKLVEFKKRSLVQAENTKNKKTKNKFLKTVKWCHKVFAIDHALQGSDNYVIFLDGDTYTKNTVKHNELEDLCEDNLFAVHFEKLQGMTHFETGLIIFNCRHADMPTLKKNLTSGYDTDEIYKLPKSWDGFWFAVLADRLNLPVRDLANGRFRGVFTHPVVNRILVHEAGNTKYHGTEYNKFTGRKKGEEYRFNSWDA